MVARRSMPLERRAVQVIGVRVREQHDVDALERAVGQTGRPQAAQRVQRAREQRIGDDARAPVADERRGVADERDAALARGRQRESAAAGDAMSCGGPPSADGMSARSHCRRKLGTPPCSASEPRRRCASSSSAARRESTAADVAEIDGGGRSGTR